ncbi:hypothetical protein [Bacillus solitudinis]|uniref:hypothetical protein n=1 Tax=Bacillus solitudinis TaxID=2014074 RepID=UPI000C246238|nr:hypothetical protein [Bacillus solitudinis]
MISFIVLGGSITLIAAFLFGYGWFNQGVFLFGPFIATLIGLNFILIASIRLKQEREEPS